MGWNGGRHLLAFSIQVNNKTRDSCSHDHCLANAFTTPHPTYRHKHTVGIHTHACMHTQTHSCTYASTVPSKVVPNLLSSSSAGMSEDERKGAFAQFVSVTPSQPAFVAFADDEEREPSTSLYRY